MKTIKLIGKESHYLENLIEGETFNLSSNADEIKLFSLNEPIANQTRYIIELSPDEDNPLNYDGLTIALKIYFKHLQKNLLEFEILLFGFDNKESIFQHSDYSFFLKCPNVNYQKLNFNSNWKFEDTIHPIHKEEAKTALKKVGIKPPTSYKTHHSIANEWAIFRWSAYMAIDTSLKQEITNSLYFQYLMTVDEIEPVKTKKSFLPFKGKILLIDDEMDKGWDKFFVGLKFSSDKQLKIDSIGKEFKSLGTRISVIKFIEEKIEDFNPDTIILDLRLLDSDFNELNPKELTGFKVLRKIKNEINKGIQVILFTASNKIWNYQALSEVGFDGWIIKESPELSTDPNYTRNAIKDLKKQIEVSLNRKYLKNIFKRKENLILSIDKMNYDIDFLQAIKNQINIAYHLLLKAETKEQFAYAYVSLYMIIEMVNDQFIGQNMENMFWYIERKKLKNWTYADGRYVEFSEVKNKETDEILKLEYVNGSKPPEWKKLAGLYFQSWNGQEHKFVRNAYHLITKRNGFIHNDSDILNRTKKDRDGYKVLDKYGKPTYLNHDIFESRGFIKLFDLIEEIINFL